MAEIEIRMNLPASNTASHIVGMSGTPYLVRADADGVRWCTMLLKDAEAVLLNSDPSCAPWRSANPSMFQRVGGEVKKPEPGVRVADLHVARDAALRDPQDRFGSANEILRQLGRRIR
jgi:hypothetical protein